MIKIQCSIVGYGNKPETLFSAYDEKNNILIVSTIAGSYQRERKDDCLVITNDTSIDRDSLFTEKDIKEAIQAFFIMNGGVSSDGKSPRLVFNDKAVRANPQSSIEKDGIDESGMKYRINESITSSQVAALATCLYCCNKASAVIAALDMFDELNDIELEVGDILTI